MAILVQTNSIPSFNLIFQICHEKKKNARLYILVLLLSNSSCVDLFTCFFFLKTNKRIKTQRNQRGINLTTEIQGVHNLIFL
jgi:hypothetical protein